jgi:2,4-dienoyl-CoA reductase-like NADH-dependent reductase (Old Yellow Enzyme family)
MTSISDPLTLPCGVVLPNRIAKAAMSEQLADRNNAPDHRLRNLYSRWSNSGAALLITGNVMVAPTAVSEPRQVVLDADRHLPAFRSWAHAATANGAHAWLQINHAGRQIPRYLTLRPTAPSAVTVSGLGLFGTPRELSHHEITDLVGRFATTASLAIRSGFTGIEIHAAHGYLISQFLSPATNTRTDYWGGSPERRRRFLLAVVEAVRAAIGANVPLAVKLNSADFQRGGFTEDESLETIDALAATDIDLLEISGGTFESAAMVGATPAQLRESTRVREAYFLDFAQRARARVTLPLMVTGGFRSCAGMNAALDSGVDVVGIARPMAVQPDLPKKLLTGAWTNSDPETHTKHQGTQRGNTFARAAADIMWHTEQLWRMARGAEPDLGINPTASLARMLAAQAIASTRRKLSA